MTVTHREYVTFKHIKTRKVVVLEIEIPEERFQEVISTLGMPIGGESKPVAIALLDNQVTNKVPVVGSSNIQQTEGKRLRTRAILLCKDMSFQVYINQRFHYTDVINATEEDAAHYIYQRCNISSRSELATNIEAQVLFKRLLEEYGAWRLEQQYSDNLER